MDDLKALIETRRDDRCKTDLTSLILFDKVLCTFVETKNRRSRLAAAVIDIGGYHVKAPEFVKMVGYKDFIKIHGISEIIAFGMKLYLKIHCGVEWK